METYQLLGVRWYGEGLFVKDTVPGSRIKASRLFRVNEGDFVYSRLFAWKGSFAVAGPDHDGCYVSNEFPTYRATPDLNADFLALYFRQEATWREALGLSSGSTSTSRNRLKEEQFLSLEVPCPSIAEQEHIIHHVSTVLERVSEGRQLRAHAVDLAAELWEAAARERLLPLRSDRSLPLGELVEIKGGGTPAKNNPFYWDGEIPWIAPKDLKTREIRSVTARISQEATESSSAKLLPTESVLVVVRGMILARHVPIAILRVPAAINQDLKALIPGPDLDPDYLYVALRGFNRELSALVERSSHDTRKLPIPSLTAFELPVPELGAQRKIVEELDRVEDAVSGLAWKQAASAELFDSLPGAVLARTFGIETRLTEAA